MYEGMENHIITIVLLLILIGWIPFIYVHTWMAAHDLVKN